VLMNCWKCFKVLSEKEIKVGFRAVCPSCDVDLHTCSNCRYYCIGKPNDCLVPGTESIRDREAANFCEEFKPKTNTPSSISKEKEKTKFHSLFKEEQ
jgi:hypothetical protein